MRGDSDGQLAETFALDHRGARVLVVDDDTDGAEAAGKLLETFGCKVSLVVSAGEALERIEEGADVDLVFSDVVMPDIDGLEFAERLHELRPGCR